MVKYYNHALDNFSSCYCYRCIDWHHWAVSYPDNYWSTAINIIDTQFNMNKYNNSYWDINVLYLYNSNTNTNSKSVTVNKHYLYN